MMKCDEINLRAPEPEDLELLYSWENNKNYWVISNTLTPFSRFTLKRYLEDSHKTIFETGQVRLMIEHIKDRKTIGTIDIFEYDSLHSRAGIGILIAEEDYKRKGLATKALKCVTDYCFKTLLLNQLYCNILENNCGSMDLFTKAGFIRTGIKKAWVKTAGGYLDEYMFQMMNPRGEQANK